MHISLFTIAIPVNYTGEFRELLEATIYHSDYKMYFFKFDLGASCQHPPPPSCRLMCPYITEKAETHIRSGGVERSILPLPEIELNSFSVQPVTK
jgi:hypothetical protein